MSRVRSKDTKPEVLLRKLLFRKGFRFRLHGRNLPGTPDIVLPKFRTAIFVHGCFWHLHDCKRGTLPETRREWWKSKLEKNRERDRKNFLLLNEIGWRVAVVWECAFRKHGQDSKEHVISELSLFFRSKDLLFLEIPPAANATPNLDSTEEKENSGEEKEPMAEIPK